MSTSPKEQRFIAEAIERFGEAGQVISFRSWLSDHRAVLEKPTEIDVPGELVKAAVSSLTTMVAEMDNIVMFDDDEGAEHDNDRLYVTTLRNALVALVEHEGTATTLEQRRS